MAGGEVGLLEWFQALDGVAQVGGEGGEGLAAGVSGVGGGVRFGVLVVRGRPCSRGCVEVGGGLGGGLLQFRTVEDGGVRGAGLAPLSDLFFDGAQVFVSEQGPLSERQGVEALVLGGEGGLFGAVREGLDGSRLVVRGGAKPGLFLPGVGDTVRRTEPAETWKYSRSSQHPRPRHTYLVSRHDRVLRISRTPTASTDRSSRRMALTSRWPSGRCSPVPGGDQLLYIRVREPVCRRDKPEILSDHLARNRLDLTPGGLELCLQAVEFLCCGLGERIQGLQIRRLLSLNPLAQPQQDRPASVDDMIGKV